MPQPLTADLDTTDADEARVEVGKLFCPHRLTPRVGQQLHLRLRSHTLGKVGFSELDYGAPVRIEPEALETFYLVQIPRAGTARITYRDQQISSSPGLASVLSPDGRASMDWSADNPQSIFYVNRTTIEHQIGRLLGRPVNAPVQFALGMRMDDPAVQAWYRTLMYLHEEIRHASPFAADPHSMEYLEKLLITQLLLAQPHNFTQKLQEGRAPRSSVIRKARDLINDHHAEQLTVADIAEAVGVSVRTLQEGFRREFDTSPMHYLRESRLTSAHTALKENRGKNVSVTTIAIAHGFLHLGRFSVEYRRHFGASPSQTLNQN